MIIYIRHANDMQEEITYLHDAKIPKNKENVEDTLKTAAFLIEQYGQPEVIICSVFERAKDTLNIMRKLLGKDVEIRYDTRVGRYFTANEKKQPSVRPTTLEMKPSIYETWSKFKLRVQDHVNDLIEDASMKSRHRVTWVITHTLVIKEVAKYLKFDVPEYFEFLLWLCVRSHGPEFKCSYLSVSNGPEEIEVLQRDLNREKGKKRRAKAAKGTSDSDDRGKGKGKKEDDSSSLFSSDDSGELEYDIVAKDPEEEKKQKERELAKQKEAKRREKERRRMEREAELEKRGKHRNRKHNDRNDKRAQNAQNATSKPKPTTVDDLIKQREVNKKENEQYQKRLFGAGIDGHIEDARRVQYRIVQDQNEEKKKLDMAKGSNIDDFARILFK
jgi:broad specificity phosphatase PhoE